jgi:hypothetical protein
MILDDSVATVVLSAVFRAAGGRTCQVVRITEVEKFTSLDPGAVHGAITELLNAGLLQPGSTNEHLDRLKSRMRKHLGKTTATYLS